MRRELASIYPHPHSPWANLELLRLRKMEKERQAEAQVDYEIAQLTALICGVECDPAEMWTFLNSDAGYRHPTIIWRALQYPAQNRHYDEHVASLFARMRDDFLAWASPPAA